MGKRIDPAILKDAYDRGSINQEDYEWGLVIYNPVLWAKTHLRDPEDPTKPLEYRWYQREVIEDDHRLRCLRFGRRCGKCEIGSNRILLSDGTYKQVSDLYGKHFNVWSLNVNMEFREDIAVCTSNGIKDVFEVILSNGNSITLTENHPLLKLETDNSKPIWTMVGDLSIGDKVAIPKYDENTNPIDVLWVSVNDIIYRDKQETYMISVKNNQNYISNDIVVHNSLALVTEALWHVVTENDFNVVIVTPFKKQLKALWREMKRLIKNSPEIQDKLIGRPKEGAEYEIKFDNGSYIEGVALNRNPEAIRGSDAKMLYVDEADYMSEEAIQAFNALLMSHKNVKIWASSTPSGARAWFYKMCTSDDSHEYHRPSWFNPNWDENMEKLMRVTYHTEEAWEHEVCANWGSPSWHVFKPKHIDKAIERGRGLYDSSDRLYSYDDVVIKDRTQALYYVGVDWNTYVHGVQIIVLEYLLPNDSNPNPRLIVVDHYSVGSAEYTQMKAVDALVQIIKVYNPVTVAVDEGFGGAQIEWLQEYGERNPSLGINNVLLTVNFSSTIEVVNPITNEIVKKRMKPYLYDMAAQELADGNLLVVPKCEDVKDGLIDQMKKFKVEGVTTLGNVRFSKEDDHVLDAWVLGIYAFSLKRSSFFKKKKEAVGYMVTDPEYNIAERLSRGGGAFVDRLSSLPDSKDDLQKYRMTNEKELSSIENEKKRQGYSGMYVKSNRQHFMNKRLTNRRIF